MLTIEYRVNGQLIGFTNIKNIGPIELTPDEFLYEFSHKPVDMRGTMSGTLSHVRADGFEVLVLKVLKKITKQ